MVGIFHIIPAILGPRDLSGPISFRKPILFGISTGVTVLSLGWILQLVETKHKLLLAWVIAATALLEVALISLQPWRGEASHFNNTSPLDSFIHYTIDVAVICLMLAIFWLGYFTFVQKFHANFAMRWAVRAGMLFLQFSCLFGVYMLIYGINRVSQNQAPDIWGEAGVLKFVHGVTIHSIQILPIQVWLMTLYRWGAPTQNKAIILTTAGHTLLLAYAVLQTFQGKARFPETLQDANFFLLVIALLTMSLPLAPLLIDFVKSKAVP